MTSLRIIDFNVVAEAKDGTETNLLHGLLPRQWDNLTTNSPTSNKCSYATIPGEMKTLDSKSFSFEINFRAFCQPCLM